MSRELFDSDEQYREQLFKELIEITKELGWDVAIPKSNDPNEEVKGLIIGQSDYVENIMNVLDDMDVED